jgi:hypothetical protein
VQDIFPEDQGDLSQDNRIAVTKISAFVDDLPHVCNETLHLSFRLILCPRTSNFKLHPHIFTGSVLRPMRKRDHQAPALFLPQHCSLFPTKYRRTSSACSRLCVRFSHRADSSEEWRLPEEARCAPAQRYVQLARGSPPSRAPLFRRRDVCRLQQQAAASAVCIGPCWRGMGTGPPLVLHSTMAAHAFAAVRPSGPGVPEAAQRISAALLRSQRILNGRHTVLWQATRCLFRHRQRCRCAERCDAERWPGSCHRGGAKQCSVLRLSSTARLLSLFIFPQKHGLLLKLDQSTLLVFACVLIWMMFGCALVTSCAWRRL